MNISKLKFNSEMIYCKKTSFGTKAFADEYLAKIERESKRPKIPIRSYLCPKCNNWHLTSWEAVDIDNVAETIQADLDAIQETYEAQFEEDMKQMKLATTSLENVNVFYHNMRLENVKLKKEIEKLKLTQTSANGRKPK